jgi:hypothetical protein
MASGDEELLRRELEHAQWRVKFLTSLLQSHRFVRTSDEEWTDKEADYVKRLASAVEELKRWEDK